MKTLLILCFLTASAAGGFIHLGLIATYYGLAYIISKDELKFTWPWWTVALIAIELMYHGVKTIMQ